MGLLTRATITLLLVPSCSDAISVDLSRIDEPQLLAVAATPAEGEPGAVVELSALWVDGSGTLAETPLEWSLCTARRPLAELGPVAGDCLEDAPEVHVDLGVAPAATATIPDDACRRFGPDPPPSEPGQPSGRPVEPDRTGGYYQPVIVSGDGDASVYGVRLDCGVAGATQAQSAELRRRHHDNVAPIGTLFHISGGNTTAIDPSVPLRVKPGAAIDLRVRWAECEQSPVCGDGACTLDEDEMTCAEDCDRGAGCGGAEWYARFDPGPLEITETRESIGVAWYGTDGTFETARTGRESTDPARSSDNTWTAPEDGTATLWVVLRDDRGAASWSQLVVEVGA